MPVDWSEIVRTAMQSRPTLELPRRLKLPVVPQSVIEFTALAEDPDAGPRELAAPIEADSVLTLELLRQVNSAALGLRQQVVSVPQAINLLGPRRTKMLVLTSALQTATSRMSSRLINTTQFQREHRIRAAFARAAARELGCDAEIASAAGLLQDFLLPLLTEAFASDYANLFRQGGELVDIERERFGWDHAVIAAGLMHDWGFPDELVVSVLWHHEVDRLMSHPELRETSVSAAIAAAALPESLGQSPAGFQTLLILQEVLPNFCFLEAASAVDDELSDVGTWPGHEFGLCERLAKLAEENLEERRLDRVHRHRQLGNYSLEEELGKGGMGVVYKASHCMLKRPAAIKVLNSTKIHPDSLARFETEVQLTCRLTSPHTIAVYDYGVTAEGLFYYVMEYLDGITLAQLVQEDGPQPAGRVIHLLQQACCSLAEAHSVGLIHRDLKPENLMLCYRGGVPDMLKVLDFGLAKFVSEQSAGESTATTFSGTPLYIPPEAIKTPHLVDARSDLYSLGAVAYFLLTGEPVFLGNTVKEVLLQHLHEPPQRPSRRLGAPIDTDLELLILKCLAKEQDRRPTGIQEFATLLSSCRSANTWNRQDAADWWSQRVPIFQESSRVPSSLLASTRKLGL
jgi:serine/threonine-protein kinase